jgi:hypothetical protein
MTAVLLHTLLQALCIYLVKNPLFPDANSERKETFAFKVGNQDNPSLPPLYLEFCCYSTRYQNNPNVLFVDVVGYTLGLVDGIGVEKGAKRSLELIVYMVGHHCKLLRNSSSR